jgi:hypothetical protein
VFGLGSILHTPPTSDSISVSDPFVSVDVAPTATQEPWVGQETLNSWLVPDGGFGVVSVDQNDVGDAPEAGATGSREPATDETTTRQAANADIDRRECGRFRTNSIDNIRLVIPVIGGRR